MRDILKSVVILGLIGFSIPVNAQRTNYLKLFVNGKTTNEVTQRIDTLVWECNCGPGDILLLET